MPSKRKASGQAIGAAVEAKKSRHNSSTSTLIPISERKIATKGVREPELLHMLCTDKATGEKKELHFKKLVHAEIDWDNKEHIDKINAWRNQIYGRAGIKNKTVTMWAKDEEAYLELYWQLLAVEANKRDILMPRAKIMREDFNDFFRGKVFRASGGEEYAPREDRGSGPFTSKMTRLVKSLRPYVEGKLQGQRGNSFYPKINQKMLSEYRTLKEDLANLGCKDAKVIPWEEVEDAQNTKDYVLRCREFIAKLPEQDDVDMEQSDDEDITIAASEEQEKLDQELLELATDPNDIKIDTIDSQEEESLDEPATPLCEVPATVLNGKHVSPILLMPSLTLA